MSSKVKHKIICSTGMRKKVLKDIKQSLSDIAEISFLSSWLTKEFFNKIQDVEALVVFSEVVNEELLNKAKKLKVVSRFGVGYDKVDVDACIERGIFVTYTPKVLSLAVAELTLALILALSRRILGADCFVRNLWGKPESTLLPLRNNLSNKILGIIGLGRIGYEVALRAKAFGMRIVYWDKVRNYNAEKILQAKHVSLKKLLKNSDYVTIHVPLTNETRFLLGEKEFGLMKKTAYIINTSRGAVIDENALGNALKKTVIAGAGLDVFVDEPLPLSSPLVKMKNVILTPHMATHTVETRREMVSTVTTDIRRALNGDIPLHLVPEIRKEKVKDNISSWRVDKQNI
jgi:lactate dehydrogenase-like 2-hydroxyacid dehydrogenase